MDFDVNTFDKFSRKSSNNLSSIENQTESMPNNNNIIHDNLLLKNSKQSLSNIKLGEEIKMLKSELNSIKS